MTAPNPLESLLERVRAIAGDATAAQLLPDLGQFFEQFQLVPKATFDNHLASLQALKAQVATLEARITQLEDARH